MFVLLLTAFFFSACDKLYDDSEEGIDDGTEIVGGTDKDTGSDDEDEGDGEYDDDTGISFGDVVDVETFISKPIVDQVWVKGYIVGSATGAMVRNGMILNLRLITIQHYSWLTILQQQTFLMLFQYASRHAQRKYVRNSI